MKVVLQIYYVKDYLRKKLYISSVPRTGVPLRSGALLFRQTAPDPLPAWGGSGDATCPGGGSPQPKQLGAPDLPRSSGPPYTIRTPQRGGTDTPPGAGPEPPRVSGCGHARGTVWLPLEDSPTYRIQYGRRSGARGSFCQVALLVACYQGAQCSRWRRPCRICQSTMPVGHDGSVSPIMTPAR